MLIDIIDAVLITNIRLAAMFANVIETAMLPYIIGAAMLGKNSLEHQC